MSISVAAGTSEATVPVRGAVEAGQLEDELLLRSHPNDPSQAKHPTIPMRRGRKGRKIRAKRAGR
jgi:hypothetical protein